MGVALISLCVLSFTWGGLLDLSPFVTFITGSFFFFAFFVELFHRVGNSFIFLFSFSVIGVSIVISGFLLDLLGFWVSVHEEINHNIPL